MYPPMIPHVQLKTVKRGSIDMPAMKRGATRYRNGLTDIELRASICSVTRIVPNSAQMAAPTLPVTMNAVKTGPNSTSMAFVTISPVALARPLSDNWKKDCAASTMPVENPVIATTGNERTPISYIWSRIRPHLGGRRIVAQITETIRTKYPPIAASIFVIVLFISDARALAECGF